MSKQLRGARTIRWAVAGLGHIAQVAVLPAFAHARGSRLAVLVSDDPRKLRALSRRHGVEVAGGYDELEDLLARGECDALYVALPNHLHAGLTIRALRAGVHVLCEKPMAVTAAQCERMNDAARACRKELMIAYRLHFERANLEAVRAVAQRQLGDVHHVHGVLTLRVRDRDNIRLGSRALGGGPMYDLGIYCLNAGRYLFRAEPVEVMAFESEARSPAGSELRIHGHVRFPGDRELTFFASVASQAISQLRVVGTKGDLLVDNAFDYVEPMRHVLTIGDRKRTRTFPVRDQFAAELVYFADCIRRGREPEPSGREGLADVRVIEALHRSARLGRPVRLPPFAKARRPDLRQEIRRPAVAREPREIAANSPSKPG